MFKKIRRNSKQLLESRSKSLATETTATTSSPSSTLSPSTSASNAPIRVKTTFFHLPAELRNTIYEDVAKESSIHLPPPSKKAVNNMKSASFAVPKMLQVSKQTRQEYLPILLEFAAIAAVVQDFDFRNLIRVASSLYRTELRALRNNPHLSICLQVDRCGKNSLANLRNWLVNRAEALDRLAWDYSIVWSENNNKSTQKILLPLTSQVRKVNNTYLPRRRVLEQNLGAMAQLHHNLSEALQFELKFVVGVFEGELAAVLPRAEEEAEERLVEGY